MPVLCFVKLNALHKFIHVRLAKGREVLPKQLTPFKIEVHAGIKNNRKQQGCRTNKDEFFVFVLEHTQ
jgi:hypothetical protein